MTTMNDAQREAMIRAAGLAALEYALKNPAGCLFCDNEEVGIHRMACPLFPMNSLAPVSWESIRNEKLLREYPNGSFYMWEGSLLINEEYDIEIDWVDETPKSNHELMLIAFKEWETGIIPSPGYPSIDIFHGTEEPKLKPERTRATIAGEPAICAVCRTPQFITTAGIGCDKGHGAVKSLPESAGFVYGGFQHPRATMILPTTPLGIQFLTICGVCGGPQFDSTKGPSCVNQASHTEGSMSLLEPFKKEINKRTYEMHCAECGEPQYVTTKPNVATCKQGHNARSIVKQDFAAPLPPSSIVHAGASDNLTGLASDLLIRGVLVPITKLARFSPTIRGVAQAFAEQGGDVPEFLEPFKVLFDIAQGRSGSGNDVDTSNVRLSIIELMCPICKPTFGAAEFSDNKTAIKELVTAQQWCRKNHHVEDVVVPAIEVVESKAVTFAPLPQLVPPAALAAATPKKRGRKSNAEKAAIAAAEAAKLGIVSSPTNLSYEAVGWDGCIAYSKWLDAIPLTIPQQFDDSAPIESEVGA